MNDRHETPTECFLCEKDFQEGEWAIPLQQFKIGRIGGRFGLDGETERQVIIHTDCLKNIGENDG